MLFVIACFVIALNVLMVLLLSFFLTILDGFMIIIVIILNMVLCNTALTPLLRRTVDIMCFEWQNH